MVCGVCVCRCVRARLFVTVSETLSVLWTVYYTPLLLPCLRVPTTVTDVSRNLTIFGHICDLVCVCMYV